MSWELRLQAGVGTFTLDVEIEASEKTLAVIGPNGGGKTTLLRTLAGAVPISHGRVEVAGTVLFDEARGVDLPPQERRVGYVPQGYGLFGSMSVRDNVCFGVDRALPRAERREVAEKLMARFGIAGLARRFPRHLSGGEAQRVALARALASKPRVLLLDEPLAALDLPARRSMRALLGDWIAELGIPTIMVTHDVRDAQAFAGRLVVLEEGRVVTSGSCEEVRAVGIDDFVREFFAV